MLNLSDVLPIATVTLGKHENSVVSARSLHQALGVGSDFTTWIKARISAYGFIEGVDYIVVENLRSPERVSTKARQQKAHDYQIALNMAKELSMVERTEQGRSIRQYFIRCEEELVRRAPLKVAEMRQQLKSRLTAASYFKPMCDALMIARARKGKNTQPYHYTTESNMVARLVLGGITAKQWAQANDVQGNPRDSMSTGQLEHFSYLEQSNITLIELGQDYPTRKTELTKLSQRWLAKQQGGERA